MTKLHIQKTAIAITEYENFNSYLILNKIPYCKERFKENYKILTEKLKNYCLVPAKRQGQGVVNGAFKGAPDLYQDTGSAAIRAYPANWGTLMRQ